MSVGNKFQNINCAGMQMATVVKRCPRTKRGYLFM